MSKIDLDPITSGYNLSKINANFQKVEDELNNKVLYRNSPTGEPNSMSSNLDMNGNKILNVVTGTSPSDLATRGYVDEEIAEERVYVDQQLYLVNSELDTKYDKTGGPVFGDINLNGHKLIGASEVQTSKTSTSILEINGVPVVPGNSVIDPYNGTREALRRSYAEAGYNLVDGSFEAGGVLNSATDVLLHEASGKAYSGAGPFPQTVVAGTVPGTGFTDRSGALLKNWSAEQFQAASIKKLQNVSFATGATITEANAALYNQANGFYYTYTGTLPVTVPPTSAPTASWVCVGLLNGYPLNNVKSWVIDASVTNATQTTAAVNLMLASLKTLSMYECYIGEFSQLHFNGTLSVPNNLKLIGKGQFTNPLIYHGTGDAISYGGNLYLERFNLQQGDTTYTGRGLVCSGTGQQSNGSLREVHVKGFRYGNVARYSIWMTYSNVNFSHCACAIRYLRNDTATDKYDPPAIGNWNYTSGWFHNVIDMSMVTIDTCEVGVWGAMMCAIINAPTVQGIAARGGGGVNLVLPDEVPSCAMYLQGGKSTPASTAAGIGSWMLEINQLYIESANAGVIIEGIKRVHLSLFVQGKSSPTMLFAVKATGGSHVTVTQFTGQDPLATYFIATLGARIEAEPIHGVNSGPMFASGDGTGQGIVKDPIKYLRLSGATGVSGRKYLLGSLTGGVYEITVAGVINGSSVNGGVFTLDNLSSVIGCAYSPFKPVTLDPAAPVIPDGFTSTPFALEVSGSNVYLVCKTSYSVDAYIGIDCKWRYNAIQYQTLDNTPV